MRCEGTKGNTMSTYGLTCQAEIWRSELKVWKAALVLQMGTGYVYWEGSDSADVRYLRSAAVDLRARSLRPQQTQLAPVTKSRPAVDFLPFLFCPLMFVSLPYFSFSLHFTLPYSLASRRLYLFLQSERTR